MHSTICAATVMDIHTKWYKQNTTDSITVYLYTTEIKWYEISGFRDFGIKDKGLGTFTTLEGGGGRVMVGRQ